MTHRQSKWGSVCIVPQRLLLTLMVCWLVSACKTPEQAVPHESTVKAFFRVKGNQARQICQDQAMRARASGAPVIDPPSEVWRYFEAARRGDWERIARLFKRMARRSHQFASRAEDVDERLGPALWQPINETFHFYEQCGATDPGHLLSFGREIIESLPPEAIYFGGTNPGRFIVTALAQTRTTGHRIFVLTQSQLSNRPYFEYVQCVYGDALQLPTGEDMTRLFEDYVAEARQRLEDNKLKPGENVRLDSEGRLQIRGWGAVWEVIARSAKVIFENNPSHQFFLEQSEPADWMYPYLVPHQLVLRINREPLDELSPAIVAADRDFWCKRIDPLLGVWLREHISVDHLCAFVEKVFLTQDLSDFKGDPGFVKTAWPWHKGPEHIGASIAFGHARAAIADVYLWRTRHAATPAQQQRMLAAAEFAFQQAFALCPYGKEAVTGYINLLLATGRFRDAQSIARVAGALDPEGFKGIQEQLNRM